jgi:hypothetical protein
MFINFCRPYKHESKFSPFKEFYVAINPPSILFFFVLFSDNEDGRNML